MRARQHGAVGTLVLMGALAALIGPSLIVGTTAQAEERSPSPGPTATQAASFEFGPGMSLALRLAAVGVLLASAIVVIRAMRRAVARRPLVLWPFLGCCALLVFAIVTPGNRPLWGSPMAVTDAVLLGGFFACAASFMATLSLVTGRARAEGTLPSRPEGGSGQIDESDPDVGGQDTAGA